jgi:hypothetical protein
MQLVDALKESADRKPQRADPAEVKYVHVS